jgi:hypothetical protein
MMGYLEFNRSPKRLSKDQRWKESIKTFETRKKLVTKLNTLSLRKRLITTLKNDQIIYVGDLLNRSEIDLSRCPYVGPKSMKEIKKVLNTMNLALDCFEPVVPDEWLEELLEAHEHDLRYFTNYTFQTYLSLTDSLKELEVCKQKNRGPRHLVHFINNDFKIPF